MAKERISELASLRLSQKKISKLKTKRKTKEKEKKKSRTEYPREVGQLQNV